MAEGLLQHYGAGRFEAFSAGSSPSSKINDGAIATLKRHNINASYDAFKSQSWDDFAGTKFDIVITVCDNAAGEVCPAYLGGALKAHWGVEDPSITKTTAAFDAAFAILQKRVIVLVGLDLNNLSKDELKQELDKIGNLK